MDAPLMRDLTIPDILFLDLETSGLYRNDLSMDDPGQPWCLEIGAALCNRSGQRTQAMAHIIKASNRMTKEAAAEVHGITARAADQVGIPESKVLGCLLEMLKTAPVRGMKVVTFGDMDLKVIASLLARFAIFMNQPSTAFDKYWLSRPLTTFINLQDPILTQLCKLPSDFENGGFRWPNLDEAAAVVLGREPRTGVHDAWSDIMLLKDIYFALADRGFVEREHLEVPA